MPLLARLGQWLLTMFGVPLIRAGLEYLVGRYRERKKLRDLEAENKKLRENQEKADTQKEREDAATDLAGRFNRD